MESQSFFCFLYPFIFLSLPSFLCFFFARYMAWRRPESLVKSRFGFQFFSTIFINPGIYIYIWIYENGAKKFKSRPKRAFFFSPETISKVDDIKIKRKVSPFFLPLHVYLPFIAVLSLFFSRFLGLKKALRFSEIKVKIRVFGIEFFSTIFVNSNIYLTVFAKTCP